MIDIRKLKELVKLMVANDLTELDLRDTEEQVTLRRAGPHPPTVAPVGAPVAAIAPPPAAAAETTTSATPADGEGVSDDELHIIQSPMVGTFYAKPNPDDEPFVNVGGRVAADTVVCLIEAMKIFNEIKAECEGTIHRVLVESGDSVEFGEPLFEVRPD
ncbi:MAG: acetyl-CoA carboxylase biotin carboxyl carrier protein [Planctomycetota bacterium]|jgi:acetyl-CoA carboxylase biotin carboxyl carrier protein